MKNTTKRGLFKFLHAYWHRRQCFHDKMAHENYFQPMVAGDDISCWVSLIGDVGFENGYWYKIGITAVKSEPYIDDQDKMFAVHRAYISWPLSSMWMVWAATGSEELAEKSIHEFIIPRGTKYYIRDRWYYPETIRRIE